MFKEALSNIASNFSGFIKSGIDNTTSRLIKEGIENISQRSPLLGDIATNFIKNRTQEIDRKEKINNFINNDASRGLRYSVTEELGKNADKQTIDKQMFIVLDKITKSIQKIGEIETKRSSEFGRYSVVIDAMKKSVEKSTNTPKTTRTSSSLNTKLLEKIDTNTQEAATALVNLTGSRISPIGKQTQQYLDPASGQPTVKAAANGIGGKFLSKVFDDDVIDKYSAKTKKYLFGTIQETAPEQNVTESVIPKVRKAQPRDSKGRFIKSTDVTNKTDSKQISSILKDAVTNKESIRTVDSKESEKEYFEKTDKRSKESNNISKQILDELRSINRKPSGAESKLSGGIVDNVISKLPSLGSTAGLLKNVAGVGLAGAAGYTLGSQVIAPLIDQGISKLTGKDNSLGAWIYDKLHPEAEFDKTPSPTIKQQKFSSIVSTLSDKKEKIIANQTETKKQPIIISQNSPVNNQGSQSNSSSLVVTPIMVRNTDSTFEKVQMQDYWPRTA